MSCCQRLPTTSLSVTENRHHTMMTLGTRPLTGSAATLFALALLTQLAGTVAAPNPLPTAAPTKVQPQKRGISSWASSVAQGLPTDVASGVLPAFQGLPNADEVKQQLNLTDDDINRLPQSVLNIPSYANWTGQGWNMRIHGVAYKQPQATDEQLDQISSVFISDLETSSLNDTERRQSRNMSALMIAIPTPDVTLNFSLVNPLTGDSLLLEFPNKTDDRGEFDKFIQLVGQIPNNNTVASWPLFTTGINDGNSSLWLVPPEGVTILSDIDDILRFTQIYVPQNGLDNSFAHPFIPWSDMPSVYAQWSQVHQNAHFHYLTTTPQPFTRQYVDFVNKYYPAGSFDDRPLNLTTFDQIFQIRKTNLIRFYETYPTRKIVLVGDTSNGDIMRNYPGMLKDFPNQTACVLIRNTSATDSQNHFPYNTKEFKDLPTNKYMFFRTTDDIRNLNFANGDCLNSSVPQNVTFDYQGTPFDSTSSAISNSPRTWGIIVGQALALTAALCML